MLSFIDDPQDKRFAILYVENEPYRRVYRSLFRKYLSVLRKAESFEEAFSQVEKKVALEQAIKMLSMRSHFCEALREKLKRKELSKDAIDHAITFCREQGYLDDEKEGLRFVEHLVEKGYGPKMILLKLKQRGIRSEEILSDLLRVAYETEEKACANFLRKKNIEDRKKRAAALLRRGFSSEILYKTL